MVNYMCIYRNIHLVVRLSSFMRNSPKEVDGASVLSVVSEEGKHGKI